ARGAGARGARLPDGVGATPRAGGVPPRPAEPLRRPEGRAHRARPARARPARRARPRPPPGERHAPVAVRGAVVAGGAGPALPAAHLRARLPPPRRRGLRPHGGHAVRARRGGRAAASAGGAEPGLRPAAPAGASAQPAGSPEPPPPDESTVNDTLTLTR